MPVSDIRSVLPGSICRGRPPAERPRSHYQARQPSQWRRLVFVQVSYIAFAFAMHKTARLTGKEVSKVVTYLPLRRTFLSQCERRVVQSTLHMLTLLQVFGL